MIGHRQGRWIRLARGAAAVVASAALVLDGAPAFAQRRRAEPEASPDFQSQAPAKPEGGPVGDASAAETSIETSAPAAPAQAAEASEPAEAPVRPRAVQSIQIGAASETKAAATGPASALDARVTVRVNGAPLATFLNTISAQAKINFIITEGMEQKRVTAFLQNVTVREALQVLLEIKGMTYQQVGKSNTYIVTQRSKEAVNLITRIYPLSYIPLIPLTSDDLDTGTSAAGGGSAGGASAASAAGGGGGGGSKPCSTKNLKISVARILCSVLSSHGDIELESRTNSIIVTDIPEVFPQVEQIIAELDRKAPQVMIEAQIVEIDSDRTRNLGFEWGGTNGELATFTGGARDTSFPLNLPSHLANMHFFDPLNPSGGIISSLGNSGTSGGTTSSANPSVSQTGYLKTSVLDLSQLKITLRALVSRSEGRFLGKPKILTLNNKTATIEIASNQAVSVQSAIQAAQSSSLTTQTVDRAETGVILKVTPQVNKEGYITMLLQPSFTDVQASALSSRVFDTVKRSASTMVRVKNGQTLVLGGLLRSTESKVVRKVPFLGYIPIIGWLFTSTTNSRQNTDLVIFITPTVVSD